MLCALPHDDQFIALLESPLEDRTRSRCASAAATAGLTGRAAAEELRVSGRPRPCAREPCNREYCDCIIPHVANSASKSVSARGLPAAPEAPTRLSDSESGSDDEDPSSEACKQSSTRDEEGMCGVNVECRIVIAAAARVWPIFDCSRRGRLSPTASDLPDWSSSISAIRPRPVRHPSVRSPSAPSWSLCCFRCRQSCRCMGVEFE